MHEYKVKKMLNFKNLEKKIRFTFFFISICFFSACSDTHKKSIIELDIHENDSNTMLSSVEKLVDKNLSSNTNGLNCAYWNVQDDDHDGLTNERELQLGTNFHNSDSDNDFIADNSCGGAGCAETIVDIDYCNAVCTTVQHCEHR